MTNGAAFPSAAFTVDGKGLPLIRIRDVGADRPSTWYSGDWDTQHLVPPGAMLVGMDGDFRVARWRSDQGLLNQRVCRIDTNTEIYNDRFLELALQGYLDLIWEATSSTTVKHLSSRSIQDVPVPNPPLDEQRRIVEILEDHLSRLDAAADYASAAAARLKSLSARTLMDVRTGDLVPLSSLAWDAGYGTSAKCVADGPGPAVVRIPNLIDGRVDLTDEKRVASADVDVSSSMLSPNDLLIVRTNGSVDLIGRSAVVQRGVEAAFASYLIRYRLRVEAVRPPWVHAMLSTPQARQTLESLAASSAGQHNLSLAKLNPLTIPVPSLREQDAALRRLDDVEAHSGALRHEINATGQRSAALRRAVLAAAFSGKLTGHRTDVEVIEELTGAGV